MVDIYTVNKITKSDALCDEDYVLATDYDALEAELAKAKRALERAGFENDGGQEWKPTNDEIRALVDKMEQLAPILQQGGQLSAGYMLDRARTAIETLLARQADGDRREMDLYSAGCELNEMREEALSVVDNFDPTWPEDGLRKLRAILDPL